MWMATPRSEWPSAFCIGGVSLISFGFFGILYFFLEVETFCPPPTICRPDPWPDPLVHFALLIAGGALLIAGARRPGSIPRRSLLFARGVACLIVGSGVVGRRSDQMKLRARLVDGGQCATARRRAELQRFILNAAHRPAHQRGEERVDELQERRFPRGPFGTASGRSFADGRTWRQEPHGCRSRRREPHRSIRGRCSDHLARIKPDKARRRRAKAGERPLPR